MDVWNDLTFVCTTVARTRLVSFSPVYVLYFIFIYIYIYIIHTVMRTISCFDGHKNVRTLNKPSCYVYNIMYYYYYQNSSSCTIKFWIETKRKTKMSYVLLFFIFPEKQNLDRGKRVDTIYNTSWFGWLHPS